MASHEDRTIPRRAFIRGAAGLIGASAIGLPSSALAFLNPSSVLGVSCAYWNGSSFVPAESLKSGDSTLTAIRLTIAAGGEAGDLFGIDASPMVGSGRSVKPAVFHAWTAPPEGVQVTQCVLPVHSTAGLTLTPVVVIKGKEVESPLPFTTRTLSGPKLREGEYVVVAGSVNWNAFAMEQGKMVNRSNHEPASIQHAVLTVERA